jgi:hypothetical protein
MSAEQLSKDVEGVQRLGAPSEPPASFTSTDIKQIDTNLFLGEEASLWRPLVSLQFCLCQGFYLV